MGSRSIGLGGVATLALLCGCAAPPPATPDPTPTPTPTPGFDPLPAVEAMLGEPAMGPMFRPSDSFPRRLGQSHKTVEADWIRVAVSPPGWWQEEGRFGPIDGLEFLVDPELDSVQLVRSLHDGWEPYPAPDTPSLRSQVQLMPLHRPTRPALAAHRDPLEARLRKRFLPPHVAGESRVLAFEARWTQERSLDGAFGSEEPSRWTSGMTLCTLEHGGFALATTPGTDWVADRPEGVKERFGCQRWPAEGASGRGYSTGRAW